MEIRNFAYTKPIFMLRQTLQRYNVLLKAIFLCLVIGLLYRQIFGRNDIAQLWAEFRTHLALDNIGWLIAAIALVTVNWSLETQKWRELMHRIEPIPFGRALRAVFAGVAFSVITPNRMGDYGGRILMVKADKWQTVVATLVGSFSQLIVLVSAGLIGTSYFLIHSFNLSLNYAIGLICLSIIISVSGLFLYYNIDLIIPVVRRIPYLRRGVKHLEVLREYTAVQLSYVLFYSAMRYFVYSFQYYLLLMFFGIKINLAAALTTIAFVFFVQTIVPLPPGMGLVMRGEIATEVWGSYASNPITIFAVSFGLWAMNVVIPALIGMIFIINTNVLKSLGYDGHQ
jgi:uncharacterized membrane protein YbhN (UPF0104 family)